MLNFDKNSYSGNAGSFNGYIIKIKKFAVQLFLSFVKYLYNNNTKNKLEHTIKGWVSEWHSDKMTQCVTLARRVTLAQRQNDTVCQFGTVGHFGTQGHFNTATKRHGVSLQHSDKMTRYFINKLLFN